MNIQYQPLKITLIKIVTTNKSPQKTKIYAKLSLGSQIKKTSTSEHPDGAWQECFEFEVSYHAQLFWSINIDLYENNFFFSDTLIGRTEIRLSELAGMPESFTTWFEIWHSRQAPCNVSAVGCRYLYSDNIGAMQVMIEYKYQQNAGTGFQLNAGQMYSVEPKELEGNTSFMDSIGSYLLSRETITVIEGIRSILLAYNQGLLISNTSLLTAIFMLESYYLGVPKPHTHEYITDISFVHNARHFYKFAFAAYGWKGLNFFGKGNGILKDSVRKSSDEKSVIEYLCISKPDLLTFELTSESVFKPCYFIALDKHTRSLVLSIRGTMSILDTLTDLVCEYVPWRNGFVHSGMFKSVEWFMEKIFDQLVSFSSMYKVDQVVIVGHSLGAGIAAILAILMDERKLELGPNINIHSYSFAPPCVLSKDLAEKYSHLIDSFVYGDDVIASLSYGSMLDFRSMLVCVVENLDNSNIKELLRIFSKSTLKQPMIERLHECRTHLNENNSPRLVMPGQIYHIYKKPTPTNMKNTVIEKSNTEMFNEIIVSNNMLLDHIPSKYDRGLDRAYQSLL